jgi:hypothetical protein
VGGHGRRVGAEAGCIDKDGYRQLRFAGVICRRATVIWFVATGEWLVGGLDHRDRNRVNDRLGNLRPATIQQQLANRSVQRNSRCGRKGVTALRDGRFWARISVAGHRRSLGYFDDAVSAASAYDAAAREAFGEFAHV